MKTLTPPPLTPQQRDRYDQDGLLVVESFLNADELAAVRRDIQAACDRAANLSADQPRYNLEKINDDSLNRRAAVKRPGMLRKIQGAIFEVPAIHDIFCGAKMLGLMSQLMGPELYYHSSKVMFKPAHGGSPKPWHQDAAYWTKYAAQQITVWIAIHDADENNGCVWAIPGSHHLGLIPHVGTELQVDHSRIDLTQARPVPVRAGGLLIFHSLVLHMSHRNTSDRDRWAIICDYDHLPNPAIDAPTAAVMPLTGVGISARG